MINVVDLSVISIWKSVEASIFVVSLNQSTVVSVVLSNSHEKIACWPEVMRQGSSRWLNTGWWSCTLVVRLRVSEDFFGCTVGEGGTRRWDVGDVGTDRGGGGGSLCGETVSLALAVVVPSEFSATAVISPESYCRVWRISRLLVQLSEVIRYLSPWKRTQIEIDHALLMLVNYNRPC